MTNNQKNRKKLFFIFLFIFHIVSLNTSQSSQIKSGHCKLLLNKTKFTDDSQNTAIKNLLKSKRPRIIAHGKNINISNESTWPNLLYSLQSGEGHISGFEIDIMMTKDKKMIIMHDPTFHRISKGYQTPKSKIEKFKKNFPQIASTKEQSDWDYNLLDEVSSYKLDNLKKKFKLFDPLSGYDFDILTIEDLLHAIRDEKTFEVPRHKLHPRAPPKSKVSKNFVEKHAHKKTRVKTKNPLLVYIDFKPLNNYTRRLYGLDDWHWIRNTWSLKKLKKFSKKSLQALSKTLINFNSHNKTYIAARHPKVAKMIRKVDSKINIMASPETITKDTSPEEVISLFKSFQKYSPKLIEIKYLNHVLNKDIRRWAKINQYKIMFNHISQGDNTQFTGPYKKNQKKLIKKILSKGQDIIIQTNTVKSLKKILSLTK